MSKQLVLDVHDLSAEGLRNLFFAVSGRPLEVIAPLTRNLSKRALLDYFMIADIAGDAQDERLAQEERNNTDGVYPI